MGIIDIRINAREKTHDGSLLQRMTPEQIIAQSVQFGYSEVNALCHGFQPDGNCVQVRNFVNGDVTVSPIIGPVGDVYLNTLAVSTAGQREHSIVLPLMPGLTNLYENQGLTSNSLDLESRLFVVNPDIQNNHLPGHPYTNPLAQLARQGGRLDNLLFAATFPTQESVQTARELGANPIQTADHQKATKANLRKNAEKYGITMFQGYVIENPDDLRTAVADLQSSGSESIWIKLPFASGGDGVVKLDGPVNASSILTVHQQLRNSLGDAFRVANFDGVTLDDIWPANAIAPRGGLVIERDAADQFKNAGPLNVQICSNVLEVHNNGTVKVAGEFEQITSPQGEFIGSRSITHAPDALQLIDKNNMGVANFVRDELNHSGILGTDYIIVRDAQGKLLASGLIEINLRDPISYSAQTAASRVYAHQNQIGSFINTNLTFPEPITCIEQLAQYVTVNGRSLLDGDMGSGIVTPIAVRTTFTRREDGTVVPVFASPVAKCIIVGRDPSHTQQVLNQLKIQGIK